MKKSKNLGKKIAISAVAILSAGAVAAGGVAFAEYAKTGYTGVRADTIKDNSLTKELAFSFDSKGNVTAFNGNLTDTIEIPASYSLGEKEATQRTFDNFTALDAYIYYVREKTVRTLAPGWEDEVLELEFTDAEGEKVAVKSLQSLDKFLFAVRGDGNGNDSEEGSTGVSKYAFPIVAEEFRQTYIEGDDVKVTGVQGLGLPTNDAVRTIKIPASVTSFGKAVFSECLSLENIEVDDDNLQYKDIDGILVTKGTNLCQEFPQGKTGTYTMPAEIAGFAADGLFRNSKLSKLILGNTIKTIEANVFEFAKIGVIDCSNVTNFEEHAFKYSSATQIILGDQLKTIPAYMFENMKNLTTVNIPYGVQSIGNYAFVESGITNIVIPNSVTSLGGSAFINCKNLTNVQCDAQIEVLSDYVFNGCSALTNLTLPYSLKKIGLLALGHCSALQTLNIPANVESIHARALEGLSSLTTIELPATLQGFYYDNSYEVWGTNSNQTIFQNCDKLENVVIRAGQKLQVQFSGTYYDAYFSNNQLNIYVQSNLLEDYNNTYGNGGFGNYTIQDIANYTE